jgi:hypothetical protein
MVFRHRESDFSGRRTLRRRPSLPVAALTCNFFLSRRAAGREIRQGTFRGQHGQFAAQRSGGAGRRGGGWLVAAVKGHDSLETLPGSAAARSCHSLNIPHRHHWALISSPPYIHAQTPASCGNHRRACINIQREIGRGERDRKEKKKKKKEREERGKKNKKCYTTLTTERSVRPNPTCRTIRPLRPFCRFSGPVRPGVCVCVCVCIVLAASVIGADNDAISVL